jgi:hypothetical protein
MAKNDNSRLPARAETDAETLPDVPPAPPPAEGPLPPDRPPLLPGDVADMVKTLGEPGRAHNHAAAHIREDDIHRTVLVAIAEGRCDDPKACAEEAIKTLGFKFNRHCA